MASTIQQGDLARALGKAGATFVAHIGPNATTTTIPLADLNLGSNNLAGDLVLIQAGALGSGSVDTLAVISSNTSTSLTVSSALSAAPAAGYAVWIYRIATIQADVSENIAQVGGQNVPTVSGTPAVPVQSSPVQGTLTDGSGTITTANTSQQVFAANPNRRYLLLQNISSADLWFNFTTAATTAQPSLQLPSGASFVMEGSFVSTEAVNIIGGTAGQAFVAKQG